VFNLVGKRYIFLIISLIVIIPGVISLAWKGLYIGIDFAGGSTLQFRPSQHVTNTQPIVKMLSELGFQDVQVNIGSNNTAGNQTAWVSLNTYIDPSVQGEIQKRLKDKYGDNVQPTFDHLSLSSGGKTTQVTVVTITSTKDALKATDIQDALSKTKLPNTTDPTKIDAVPTPTPTSGVSPVLTPGATPTLAVTPTVAATATPKATATVTATATPAVTPTATATPTNPYVTTDNPANTEVKVMEVKVGSTKDTINILTTTASNIGLINKIQSKFLDQNKTYLATLDNASVSASVAGDTIRNSFFAVLAASLLILLYIWYAFRKVQKPWRYGACAIVSLLHDVLLVLGVFSILGWTLHVQVDALFITALLTVVGFSVHDTIVVFDRIRENMQHRSGESFEQIVNASLIQTMSRSLNTSLTVLLTLSALTLFGGESIRSFTFALLVGIFSGTYSSIFNASMLLVIWERGELGLGRLTRDPRKADGRRMRRESRERELAKSRS